MTLSKMARADKAAGSSEASCEEPTPKKARIEQEDPAARRARREQLATLKCIMEAEFKIAPTPLPRKLRELIMFMAGDRSYKFAGEHVGMISPLTRVTAHWTKVQRGRFFCFVHPADETKRDFWRAKVSGMGLGAEEMKVVEAFFEVGGYFIFDGYLQLVEVQALLQGPGLQLRKGKTVPCRPVVVALKERLHDTTILKLAERNLKFAWLLPNEEIGEIRAGPTGGFVYLSEEYDIAYIRRLYAKLQPVGPSMSFDLAEQSDPEESTPEKPAPAGVREQMEDSSEKGPRPRVEEQTEVDQKDMDAQPEEAPGARFEEHLED